MIANATGPGRPQLRPRRWMPWPGFATGAAPEPSEVEAAQLPGRDSLKERIAAAGPVELVGLGLAAGLLACVPLVFAMWARSQERPLPPVLPPAGGPLLGGHLSVPPRPMAAVPARARAARPRRAAKGCVGHLLRLASNLDRNDLILVEKQRSYNVRRAPRLACIGQVMNFRGRVSWPPRHGGAGGSRQWRSSTTPCPRPHLPSRSGQFSPTWPLLLPSRCRVMPSGNSKNFIWKSNCVGSVLFGRIISEGVPHVGYVIRTDGAPGATFQDLRERRGRIDP
jgi:hypothetical protein